nr:RNA methyltransferase [Clostridium sp. cel8]
MNIINSKNNIQIKEIKKLRNRKYRNQKDKFLVEGFRFFEEAVKSEFIVPTIFVNEILQDKWEEFIKDKNLEDLIKGKIYYVSNKLFETISGTDNSQGVIAVVKNRKLEVKSQNGFYVLTDRIQDPGNMGTIIRSAHASGALGVILTKGTVDIYNEKTLRSTMGSIFHIPIIYDYNLENIKSLKKDGFKILASTLDTDIDFYKCKLADRIIIAVGNEGNGLSEDIINMSDINVKIPMPGSAESLNVSVAASIMMFEIVRRRLK